MGIPRELKVTVAVCVAAVCPPAGPLEEPKPNDMPEDKYCLPPSAVKVVQLEVALVAQSFRL
jgi:hypothetical protein